MRFVSKFPRFGLGTCIKEGWVLAVDGQRDLKPDPRTGWVGSLSVTFDQNETTTADVDYALSIWPEKSFTGRWLDADGVTLQPIAERIGVFDTTKHGWDDNIREYVEQWMLAKPNLGQDFALVPETVAVEASKPWPTYDDTHHFQIVKYAADLGLIEQTLAYERANKNRESVVSALEAKLEVAEDVADEVVAA